MADIFVISDTHFGHENIIRYCDRPFSSVEEMDEYMVERWNSVVTDQDKVYHLGDVYFAQGHRVLPRLKGKKRLILGNHDNGRDQNLHKTFQKIDMWRIFKEFRLVLTHVPVHESNISSIGRKNDGTPYKDLTNVHGHIHQHPSPPGKYFCVSVEQIDYTPISLEEIRDRLDKAPKV